MKMRARVDDEPLDEWRGVATPVQIEKRRAAIARGSMSMRSREFGDARQ